MSMSVAAACAGTVCDPMVYDDGMTVIPYSLASKATGLYEGKLQCAIGTPYSDKGGNAVIMAGKLDFLPHVETGTWSCRDAVFLSEWASVCPAAGMRFSS